MVRGFFSAGTQALVQTVSINSLPSPRLPVYFCAMKIISQNRKAYHDYDILETFEAGIVLRGSEVKSIRAAKIVLVDSYIAVVKGTLMLYNAHISQYTQSSMWAPDPSRVRPLLMHKKEIEYLASAVDRKQMTLIPLKIYFDKQWVKVELGLCRGRKTYDKRQKIAEQDSKRRIAGIMKEHRNAH